MKAFPSADSEQVVDERPRIAAGEECPDGLGTSYRRSRRVTPSCLAPPFWSAQGIIGIMDDKSELLDTIVARLTTVAQPARVIIFGSAVTDTATADSDIDLLILLDEVDDARVEAVRLRRALRGVAMPFDVIVMRTDRFEETKDVVGGIAYPANKYGKVIYEAA